jgi:hypothetical protein
MLIAFSLPSSANAMKRIIYQNSEGGVSVIIPTESVELALKDVPEGVPYEIVDVADIPSDRTFRGAWVMGDCCIEHDLDKCKAIGHDMRRQQRAEEFAPYDEIIAKQIPVADATAAEEARQAIREKYALIQDAIDIAEDPDTIKLALEANQS